MSNRGAMYPLILLYNTLRYMAGLRDPTISVSKHIDEKWIYILLLAPVYFTKTGSGVKICTSH